MKIAIATEGRETSPLVSSKGRRSPYYLIFEDDNFLEAIKNPFISGSGGASYSVVYILSEKNIKKFMSGEVGKNMEEALKQRGIEFIKKDISPADKIIKEINK